MADGSSQHRFPFPRPPPASRLRPGEIVVDLFAGGGGASEALEQALGRPVDIAINHDETALGMHAANHPFTLHLPEDVWHADPRRLAAGRAVGWFHASPDCTHFSQARGGQPRSRATRALSWCVVKWAGMLSRVGLGPRIISLENVEQILKWGPLVAKRCKKTGRVNKLDGTVAAPGERVSVWQQSLVPDKRHSGRTWGQFVAALEAMGDRVQWRKLVASDFGAGTSRKRLFLVARRDGEPIQWPTPTHGPAPLKPVVTAADCIDWSVPCPSIFSRKKPLADATCRRIARGLKRYVIEATDPFIVPGNVAPIVTEHANSSNARSWAADEPLRTQCANVKGGHFALSTATLVQTGYGERDGQAPRVPGLDKPVGTLVDGRKHAVVTAMLAGVGGRAGDSEPRPADQPCYTTTGKADCAVVTAYLEQAAGGPNSNESRPRGAREPVSTISTKGCQQQVVTAHLTAMAQNVPGVDPEEPLPTILAGATRFGVVAANMVTMRGDNTGAAVDEPLRTLSAGGEHHALVECTFSPEHEAGALRVAAFMVNYYGNGQPLDVREPVDTITTRDRLALVTVSIRGTPYVIVDIGLRMLRREELFRAQGFPPSYVIDRTADGRVLTVSRSVRLVGNSVSPPPLRAIAEANLDHAPDAIKAAA